MKRRILLAGAGATLCTAASAQQLPRRRRLIVAMGGVLNSENTARVTVLEQSLTTLGWRRNDTIEFDVLWGDANPDKMGSLARAIAAKQPDVVVAQSTPMTAALKRSAPTLPVVFVNVSDPVGSEFVTSLARPGGNMTGFTDIEPSLAAKWLELLKAAAPHVGKVALLFNPDTAPARGRFFIEPFEAAAPAFRVQPLQAPVHSAGEIEKAIEKLSREAHGGLAVQPEVFTGSHAAHIVALANRLRVPTIYPYRFFIAHGGLMSYGVDAADLYRRSATYVDKILRGTAARDLPVQAPVKFEFVINQTVARTLGLTIPPAILARADEVIE